MMLASFILIAFGALSLARIEINSTNGSFFIDAIATILSVILCITGFMIYLFEVV